MGNSWNNEHEEMERAVNRTVRGCGMMTLVVAALTLAVIMLCGGCRTIEVTREVPVVTEHTTEHHHTDIVRDTLYHRDSIYHYVQGDTVIIERWHHTVNINKVVVADTIRDTIPKIVTVTEVKTREVEKPMHWWQKALMWLGGAVLAGCALMIGLKINRAR